MSGNRNGHELNINSTINRVVQQLMCTDETGRTIDLLWLVNQWVERITAVWVISYLTG